MRKSIILFIFLHTLSYAFPIYFKHIGMKEGLSQLSVMSIYQDELGRMWFGTEEGLSVFDGVHVTSHKPTLKHENGKETTVGNSIDFITGDSQGNIYFNSDNSLVRYNLRSQQFTCLKQAWVNAIAFSGEQLWVNASDSIFVWDTQTEELQTGTLQPTCNLYHGRFPKTLLDRDQFRIIYERGRQAPCLYHSQ